MIQRIIVSGLVIGVFSAWQPAAANAQAADDRFGESVSLSGDYALVGMLLDDDTEDASGSAYVFERDDSGSWNRAAKLAAGDGAAGDHFGFSVSLSADRALVGAPGDDDDGADSGSAYIFERDEHGNWEQTARLTGGVGVANRYFGDSVSLSGDRALVEAASKSASSSVYIFERDDSGNWNQAAKLTAQ